MTPMYYEHEVSVKMHITTIKDEVSPADVKSTFDAGHWDYEVSNTTLLTPVEVVAKMMNEICRDGVSKYRYADRHAQDLVLEVLDDLKGRMEDFQTMYEEAL